MISKFAIGVSAAMLVVAIGVSPVQANAIPVVPYDSYPSHAWGDTTAPGAVLFDNGDTGGVSSGPSLQTRFVVPAGASYRITSITTYHWNWGGGSSPGTISLQDELSQVHGPWAASGLDSNRYWYVRPSAVIGPGTYTVLDSQPTTWSYTSGGGHTRILAEPATADTYQPDGRIRMGSGAFVGNDIYNTTASGQTRTATIRRGFTVTFTAAIGNDGSVADRFTVKAAGSTPGYKVRYLKGTTDITAVIVAGTWRTTSLAPGASQSIKARVTVLAGAAVGSKVARKLVIASVGDPTVKDALKLVVKRR